jgi:hypothetical protein
LGIHRSYYGTNLSWIPLAIESVFRSSVTRSDITKMDDHLMEPIGVWIGRTYSKNFISFVVFGTWLIGLKFEP